MEMNKQSALTKRSSKEGRESHAFTIGDSSIVIDILRNRLYARPVQTIVQEYISNAIDANRESGRPVSDIVVQAPTEMEPVFRVRDRGPGLSPERIRDVFTKYGSSTKRNTNTQIGGFGIGAKSAWAYSPMFTVHTFHDGRKSTYLAHLGDSSSGSFERVRETTTTEENGVEVEIPVQKKDIRAFHAAIARMTKFRRGDKPTVLPVPPEYAGHYAAIRVIYGLGDLVVIERPAEYTLERQESSIVIDGVPYPVSNETLFDAGFPQPTSGIWLVHAENGAVEVSASRESLVAGPQLKKFLRAKVEAARACLKQYTIGHLQAATTLEELQSRAYTVKNYLPMFGSGTKIVAQGIELEIIERGGEHLLKFDESHLSPHPHSVVEIQRGRAVLRQLAGHTIYLPGDLPTFVVEDKQYKDTTKNKVLPRGMVWLFASQPTCPASPGFVGRARSIQSYLPDRSPKQVRTNYFCLRNDRDGWKGYVRKVFDIPRKAGLLGDLNTFVYIDPSELTVTSSGGYSANENALFMLSIVSELSEGSRKYMAILNAKERADLVSRGYKCVSYADWFDQKMASNDDFDTDDLVLCQADHLREYDLRNHIPAKFRSVLDAVWRARHKRAPEYPESEYHKRWMQRAHNRLPKETRDALAFFETIRTLIPSSRSLDNDTGGVARLAYVRLAARYPEELKVLMAQSVEDFAKEIIAKAEALHA